MLAHILPGMRHVRTPLTVGFLWLFAAWLLWGRTLPSADQATGAIADVYALAEYVGPAGVLTAVSVIAYVIGVHLYELTDHIRQRINRWLYRRGTKPVPAYLFEEDLDAVLNDYARKYPDTPARELRAAELFRLQLAMDQDIAAAYFRWPAEVPDLFLELDRRKSEKEFASGTGTPLAFVALTTSITEPRLIPAAVAACLLGVWQIVRSNRLTDEINSFVFSGVVTGRATAPKTAEVLSDWHESTGRDASGSIDIILQTVRERALD